jgi:lipoprotein-anchoring transpeptidase ErfK/SrfK
MLGAAALPPAPPGLFQTARPVSATIALRTAPGGRVVARVRNRTEFGSPLVLGVAARRGDWIGVISSALPNGRLGWVPRASVRMAATPLTITVSLSRQRLVLRRGATVFRSLAVGIGTSSAPTPRGRFVVTDKLRGNAVYGCCILALSGHQPAVPRWWRGDARLAIHGGSYGSSSYGCLHASDRDLRFLMAHVPLGTPVTVQA